MDGDSMPQIANNTLQPVRRLAIIFITQYLLYGVYAVLFGICMQVLSKRSAGRYRMLSLSMILLFGFATVSLIIATLIILGETDLALAKSMQTIELDLGLEPSIAESSWGLSRFDTLSNLVLTRMALILCSNVVADAILIWRCYLLWGQQKKIIVVPVFLCVGVNTYSVAALIRAALNESGGIFSSDTPNAREFSDYTAFILGTLATNLFLTIMLAGRILYISRVVMGYVEKDVNKLYRTALAITLESGLLYPVVLILVSSVVLKEIRWLTITSESTMLAIAQNSLHQVVGIAPTLVIVRTSLGVSIEDSTNPISTFHVQGEHDESRVSPDDIVDISRPAARGGNESQASTDIEAQR